jgi:hypothetical protein
VETREDYSFPLGGWFQHSFEIGLKDKLLPTVTAGLGRKILHGSYGASPGTFFVDRETSLSLFLFPLY